MKRFMRVFLISILVFSVAGCARTKRIANDVDWVIFDGEPSKDN